MVDDDQCYCQKPRGTRKEVVPERCETVKYSKVAPTTNQKQCSPQDFTWQLLGRVVDLTPSDLHLQQRRSVRHDTRRLRPPPTAPDRQTASLPLHPLLCPLEGKSRQAPCVCLPPSPTSNMVQSIWDRPPSRHRAATQCGKHPTWLLPPAALQPRQAGPHPGLTIWMMSHVERWGIKS